MMLSVAWLQDSGGSGKGAAMTIVDGFFRQRAARRSA
jgi:hypothetical protein